MVLPEIFDMTPRIFGPRFFPEEVLNTSFSELNCTVWPMREVSLNLFDFLIETDPFAIADLFWEWFTEIGDIAQKLGAGSGLAPEDIELGFDNMFQYYLVAIFAFGVSEILEVFAFAGSFLDYVGNDAQQQFAMTNCVGIVEYITKMNAVEVHENTRPFPPH
jgi:hypothetical protein